MKVKEWFWSHNSLLIYESFLIVFSWHFRIRRFFPFLVLVTWNFYLGNVFLVELYKSTSIVFCQINSFRRQLSKWTAAVMLQFSPIFSASYSKNSPLLSANTNRKQILGKEYCIARHDEKMCFIPNCRYHILKISDIKKLLQKLDAFCFN